MSIHIITQTEQASKSMGVAMHGKSDSEVTSIEASSTPPRSPRRPLYYVQSPSHSQQDLEKMSYGSSPFGSPTHHFLLQYHCSPIHHSRESSTSRFSASSSLKNNNNRNNSGWRRMQQRKYDEVGSSTIHEEEEEDDDIDERNGGGQVKFYVLCFLFSFVLLFTIFSLIIWAASFAYKPRIVVKSISFENFNVQAGMDASGVPTDMLTLKSRVKIFYRNPATFFGVHVTSTPLELHYFDLKVASGQMKKFYQSRKSDKTVIALVEGNQVPLYGGISVLKGGGGGMSVTHVPLNLTFVLTSRAYILGRLVNPNFNRAILCQVTFRATNHPIGTNPPLNLTKSNSCIYH